MATTPTKGGCGCGGSCGCGNSASNSAACGCESNASCVDESFKRPNFFAGQLLTEDDLQALTNYVVGKNRLHNRYLFGDGVVCGLSVTCHPCGGEKVTVAPGYALDCCGNDIVLPCKEELDVKSLVRDLKQRQLQGYDCGDPCEQSTDGTRSYGLYLKYNETPEALVAPYSSPDPCGQQQCQPSRICEGYSFELRCDCSTDKRVDVFTRILACVGDLRSAAAAVAKAQANQQLAMEMQPGLTVVRSEKVVPFTESSIETIRKSESRLALFEEEVSAAEEGNGKAEISEAAVRENAAEYQVLMGALTRFKSQPAAAREEILSSSNDLQELLGMAEERLAVAGPRLVELSERKVSDPSAKVRIAENVELAEVYAIGEAPDEGFQTFEARMISTNSPVGVKQARRMQVDAGLMKSWLLERLEGSSSQTRCDLYERTLKVSVASVREDAAGVDGAVVGSNKRAVEELAKIMIAYFVDCVCLALNPVCHPCDDSAVLLACLEVQDCEVIDICNMSRRFVLSPTAMRYWLPPLGWIGKLANWTCCDLDLAKLIFRDPQQGEDQPQLDAIAAQPQTNLELFSMVEAPKTSSLALRRSFVPRLEIADVDKDVAMALSKTRLPLASLSEVGEFSANLALLSTRSVEPQIASIGVDTGVLIDKVAKRFAPAIKAEPVSLAEREIELKDALKVELVEERAKLNKELRAELEKEAAAAREEMRAALLKEVTADVSDDVEKALKAELTKSMTSEIKASVTDSVKTAVGKELTATKLKTAIGKVPTFKTLSDDNKALKTEIRNLTKKLEKLEGGGQ